jgi:ABC-type maltose transport system permease subunit
VVTLTVRAADGDERHGPFLPKGGYEDEAQCAITLSPSPLLKHYLIAELIRGDVFYWGQLMAAALLGSIPVALIYSFFVGHYVAGLTAGSVKG